MSASSSGSARSTCGPGSSPAITKLPSSLSEKPPTSLPVAGLNATTCAPITPCPFLVTRPLMLPNPRVNAGVP